MITISCLASFVLLPHSCLTLGRPKHRQAKGHQHLLAMVQNKSRYDHIGCSYRFLDFCVCCSFCCIPAMAPLIFCRSAATSDVGLLPVILLRVLPVLYVSSLTDKKTSGARLARSFNRASSLSSSCARLMSRMECPEQMQQ